MRIGLQLPRFNYAGAPESIGPVFGQIARDADQAGVDSLWVMDHFFQIGMVGPPEEAMLESYTALGYAAALTERISLGTLVTGVVHRHPGVLVKTVTTLDVLSGGRAWLGVGAAWNEEECAALGIPFPRAGERLERLEETLRIAHRMWSGDETPFEGTHYRLARPLNSPQPLRRPHPPVLVGGVGEKKTLRLVARYADACNFFGGPEELTHRLGILRGHCEREGRRYEDIEKTTNHNLTADSSAAELTDACGRLAALSFDTVIFSLGDVSEPRAAVATLAEVAEQTSGIVPAGR